MRYRPPRPRRDAFTLIELLVVLSIIALLLAILLPVLASVRDAARATICSSNQRQIGIALTTYAAEFDQEAIVFGRAGSGSLAGWPFYLAGEASSTTTDTLNLVADPTIFACPAIERTNQIIEQLGRTNEAYGVFGIDDGRPTPEFAYGSRNGTPPWHSHNIELVPIPSDYLWLTCVISSSLHSDGNRRLRAWFNQRLGQPPNGQVSLSGSGGSGMPFMVHDGAANALFYDGHVERQQAQDMRNGPLNLWQFVGQDLVRFDLP